MPLRALPRRSAGLLVATAVLGVAAPASRAAVIPFGMDLSYATDATLRTETCASGTWWYAALGNILSPASTGSCQFTSIGIANGTTFGLNAPASGTATAARVRVGAITGPMRINVVRLLFQQTGNAGSPTPSVPFLQAYGPTFTPAANAVTTVPLNLPMLAQATPAVDDTATVAATDWLALEVLSPTVPVPLVPYAGGSFFAAFPGPTAGNVPAPSAGPLPNYGQNGLVVAMNADLDTGSSAAPAPATGAPGGGGGAPAPVKLAKPSAKVKGGRAALELTCQGADCSGQVTLQRAAGAKSLGKAKFSGKAGKTVRVQVPLNSRGKALLKAKRKATVQAVVTINGAATTLPLTLRR